METDGHARGRRPTGATGGRAPGGRWHELTDRNDELDVFAEVLPIGMFRAEVGVGNVYVNERFLEITGLTRDAALGHGWLRAVHSEDRPLVERERARAAGDRRQRAIEYRIRRPDGTIRWVRMRTVPTQGRRGARTGAVGSLEDITERAASEDMTARLAALCEMTTDFVTVVDAGGCFVFVNRSARRVLGIGDDEDVTLLEMLVFVAPSSRRALVQDTRAALQRGGVWSGEVVMRARDGREIPTSQVVMAHRGPRGGVEHYSSVGRDSSREKEIERELLGRVTRLRSLVESAADLVSMHAADGSVLEVSPSVRDLLGWEPHEVIGADRSLLVHPDDIQAVAGTRERVLAGGQHASEEITLRVRHRSGRWLWLHGRMTNLLDDPYVGAIVTVSRDETARMEVAEALRASEARFRSLAASSPLGILYSDLDGNVQYVNRRWLEICGREPDGEAREGLTHPEAPPGWPELHRWVVEGRQRSAEYRIVRPDGEARDVRASVGQVRDATDAIVGYVGSLEDVTDWVAARARNDRLAALLEATPDLASITDPSGRVLYLNPGGRMLLGLEPDADLVDLRAPAVYPPSTWVRVQDEVVPTVRREGVWSGELALLAADGREVPVSQVSVAHRGPDGEVEFYSTIARDITRLKEIEARLGGSEAWFRSLVQHAVDLVTVRDADAVLRYASPALRTILGYDPEEVVGDSSRRFELHPDDHDAVAAAVREVEARPGHTKWIEYRVRHRDGSWRVLASRMTNLFADPAVRGMVTNSHDVTERREAEDARARSESALRAVVQSSPLPIFAVDPSDARTLLWNHACEELFGWSEGEVLGETLPFAAGRHPRLVGRLRDRLLAGETFRNIEGQLPRRDGEIVETSLALAPARDGQGEVVTIVGIVNDIGEQKAAETARRASEERFRSLVQYSSEFVVVYDASGRITYASPAVVRFSGQDVGDLVGQRQHDFVHPDDVERVQSVFAATTERGGSSGPFEVRLRRPTGEYAWVEMIVTNLLDDPNVGGVVINARDISERKAAEAALRESEEKFRALVQNGSDIIAILDPDGTVRYSSPAGERMLGYAEGWGVGMDATKLVHPADVDSVASVVARALETPGLTDPIVFRLRHADGSWRWVEALGNNLLDDPVIRGLVVTARDVTERIEAEDALRRNEERFRALVQNLSDVITVVDDAGRITYTSPAAARLFGFENGDESWSDPLGRVHPDDIDDVLPAFAAQLRASGEPEPVRFRLRDRAGHWRFVESIAKDMRSDPSVGGIVVTTRDVTERTVSEALVADQARILEMIASGSALPETLAAVCHAVEAHAPGALCSVLLVDEAVARLRHAAAPSLPEGYVHALAEGVPVAEGEACCGTAAARAARVVCEDVARDPLWDGYRALALAYDLRACWSTPIVSSSGEHVLGTFAVYYREPRGPDPDHVNTVGNAVHLAAIAVERKAFEDRLAHQAHHDPLTGLPNRALFLEFLVLALARAKRHRSSVAVLFLDLDRFKVVNDSLGHDAGDELLVAMGQRLKGVLRPGDTIARFGGDEFTVLCEDLSGPGARQQAVDLAERILDAIHEPFVLGGDETFLSASIGIALSAGAGSDRPDTLLRDADAAMFRAKERGKSRWELFDEEMRSRARARLETETALHRALDRGELRVFFQPIVSLADGECVGAEALVRWQHPERGLVVPAEFITLAEETGLVLPLGAWVLEAACRQVTEWEPDLGDERFVVCVNLSGRQLTQPDLVASVATVLERTGADPARVCLEFTESVLMDEAEGTLATVTALRRLGVTLSIDDFGTGYSSLGYLKRFPVDSVKVDRSFVDGLGTDAEDSAIVTAVVSLGHALGMAVIAEGVETEQQLSELVALGCDQAQGFLFARPQPAEDLLRLLGPGLRSRPAAAGLILGRGGVSIDERRRPAS